MTALVAVVTAAALARPPAVADPGPPLVYAPTGNGPRVTAVPLGGPSSGRSPWKLTLSFRCEDQTVDGSFSTRLGRDGRFEQRTEELVTHADVGSDTEVTVRGRLTDRHAEGTIDARARAYDNAGTTFECTKRGIEWQASAEDDPTAVLHVVGELGLDAEIAGRLVEQVPRPRWRKSPAGWPRPTRRPGGGVAHGRRVGSFPDGSVWPIGPPR
jgi:hypothetical protein